MSDKLTHIGGSRVAGLWNLGFHTRFGMYIEATDGVDEAKEADSKEWLEIGWEIQEFIAKQVAKRTGWNIRKISRGEVNVRGERQVVHPTLAGSAATPDMEIVGEVAPHKSLEFEPEGPGVLEIKNVSDWAYRKLWEDGNPPMSVLLQVQQQLACMDRGWWAIGALVGGNRINILTGKRHDGTIEKISVEISSFWAEVAAGSPPPILWEKDAKKVAALYSTVTAKKEIHLEDDESAQMAAYWTESGKTNAHTKTARATARAKLFEAMGDAERAILPDGTEVVTKIVEREGGAVRYRSIRVIPPKQKEMEA